MTNIDEKIMLLSKTLKGQKGIIKSIKSKKHIYKRLAVMGVFEGRDVHIISNHSGIPVIIEVAGKKMAIGREIADEIDMELDS
jgi:Fe2+ transport system protein FeoA